MAAHTRLLIAALLALFLVACDSGASESTAMDDQEERSTPTEIVESDESETQPGPSDSSDSETKEGPVFVHFSERDLERVFGAWTGDFSDMLDRRIIRALVPWSDTYYYLDGAEQKGMSFEALSSFEKWLEEKHSFGTVKPQIVILPVRRDDLLSFIAQGRGDIALGGITITPERSEIVAFTDPLSRTVSEWLIESPSADRVENKDDLSGRQVHIRRSSSYWQSLESLNNDLTSRGLKPVELMAVDEHLSTEDLMQMVNAGAFDYTVADSTLAGFWANVLVDMRVREDIVLRDDGLYAWAFRKDSPELEAVLNEFVAGHKQGTLMGNIVINRYLGDTSRLGNIHGEEEQKRLNEVLQYFQQYAPEYEFETLMMVAQGFQESRLDQSRRSHRGAVGVMQLLPSTAAEPAVGIDDISVAENNIIAGIRYMAWIKDTYFNDPDLDGFNKTAMAFASYNAGPNRVRSLRRKAEARGLDPDKWFDNVELIAAEEIGRETVDYVANIFKYYFAFSLTVDLHQGKREIE